VLNRHGVYHRASRKHIKRYVDEFAWRLNDGNVKRHSLQRLDSLVCSDSVSGQRVYRDLSPIVGDGAILWVVLRSCLQTLALVIGSGLLVACSTAQVQSKTTRDANDKAILVPEFSIAVKLSETARKKLQAMHETVLVIAYFDGDPLPGKEKDNSPMRDVVLGNDEKLADANNVATFSDTKISQSNWNDLSNKDYFVTINVVSGRRSSKNNLLDCTDPEDRVSAFAGKSTLVSCGLIGEHEGLSQ
jgi:hypothetical protein